MTWFALLRRDLLRHPGRSAASASAIAIGVAGFVAVTAGVRSVVAAIDAAGTAVDADAADLFRSIDSSLAPLAATALVLGGFLIHLVVARTVREQQGELAILRAVGVTRARLVGLVVGHAAALGLAGGGVGTGVGLVGGRGMATLLTRVFDLQVADVPAGATPWETVAQALGLALGASVVASAVPAWRAAHVDPGVTLRGDPRPPAAAPPWRAAIGVGLVVVGLAATSDLRWRSLASAAVVVGLVVAAPVLVAPVARAVGRVSGDRRIDVHLASAELGHGRSSLAAACGSLAAALALSMAVATIIASQRPPFLDAIATNFGADAVAAPIGVPLTSALIDEVRADPAVAAATAYGEIVVGVGGPTGRASDEPLRVIDPTTYFEVSGLAWTRGTDEADALEGLAAGGAVVGTNLLDDLDLDVGDELVVRTGTAATALPIVGEYFGFSYGSMDAVVVTEATARSALGYAGPTQFLLDLRPGRVLAPHGLGLGTQAGLRRQIEAQYDGVWGLVTVVLVLVSAVGVLALANTMALHVADRATTFGVLRAIGVPARSITRLVAVEALVLASVALVVGAVVGHLFGRGLVAGGTPGVSLPVSAAVPWLAVPVLAVGTVIAGIVGAAVPARLAAVDPATATRAPL